MKHKIGLSIISLFLILSCTSVEKFNQKREQKISVQELKEDVNFTQRKLFKLHPDTDLYVSNEVLNYKFDSLKNAIDKPLTSKEFYFKISPIIAQVHQGHMSMSPVYKRYTKKQSKEFKKKGDGPLSQFVFEWQDEKLYILKNNSKDSTIIAGSEVVSIKGITPQSIYHKHKKSITSDGYNTTFLRKYFTKRFTNFLTDEIGIQDSLTYVLKHNDLVFSKTVKRKKADKAKPNTVKTNDSVIKSTKSQSKVKNQLAKKVEKQKRIFGYDNATKEYIRSLKFIGKDSLTAVLKITHFSDGNYKKAYKLLFDSIQKKKCTTLILDLRDNPGGRINEIANLYSYFTDKKYTLIQPAHVVSKTSLWKSGIYNEAPKWTYPLVTIFYPFYAATTFIKTKKNKNGKYTYNLRASNENVPNELNFKGKKYVLINGGSFSASCIISSALKTDNQITFVGEETGGDFNGSVAGIMPVLRLPNSKIPWRIGLMNVIPTNQTKTIGRGIFPDKEIIQTVEDKIKKRDPELEWVLSQIYGKN